VTTPSAEGGEEFKQPTNDNGVRANIVSNAGIPNDGVARHTIIRIPVPAPGFRDGQHMGSDRVATKGEVTAGAT